MTAAELLAIVRRVPARFAPRWLADKGDAVAGNVRLCSCKLRDGRGASSPTAKWHRSGTGMASPHPNGAGIAAGEAELLWIGSMYAGLVGLGLTPTVPANADRAAILAALAAACELAGDGPQEPHDDDPLVEHAPAGVKPAPRKFDERHSDRVIESVRRLLG